MFKEHSWVKVVNLQEKDRPFFGLRAPREGDSGVVVDIHAGGKAYTVEISSLSTLECLAEFKPEELMELSEVKTIPGKSLWEPVSDPKFQNQFRRELSPLHSLFWKGTKVIARRIDSDDVLVYVRKSEKPFAVVHLSWAGRSWSSKYPSTRFFNTMEECYVAG